MIIEKCTDVALLQKMKEAAEKQCARLLKELGGDTEAEPVTGKKIIHTVDDVTEIKLETMKIDMRLLELTD